MAIWKLTIEDDEGQKTVVPLVRDEYTIGRAEGHQIRLTERNVSRDHSRLKKDAEGYVIEDLGSYNGVFINGHRLAEPHRLLTGDLILIGDFRIEAHNDDAPRAAPLTSVKPPATKALSSAPPPRSTPAEPRVDRPCRLVLLQGEGSGREFALDKTRMIMGRGDDVDIRVNHSSVSRHHCEVHQVDAGHEVVDQASANGIRINGQDVNKALLTPGDTLELGDIQLRYVGANQDFVFDAAAVEAARDHEARSGRGKRKSALATWTAFIMLVAIAGIGGVVLARQGGGHDETPPTTATSAATNDQTATPAEDPIAQAFKLKDVDLVAAHSVLARVAKDSPSRKDPRYIEVENAWADRQLKVLGSETDESKKRNGIKGVLESGADQSYRTSASDMLAAMDKRGIAPTELRTASASVANNTVSATASVPVIKPTAATVAVVTPTKPTMTATAPPTIPPTATGTPGNCPSWKGRYDDAMRAKDYECVRTMLMPRLNSNSISSGEARYLKAACAALADTACQKRAADKIQ